MRVAPSRFAPSRIVSSRYALSRFAPERFAPVRVALERFANTRVAPSRFAPSRFALWKFTLVRFAPERFIPERFTSERFTDEQLRFPAVSLKQLSRGSLPHAARQLREIATTARIRLTGLSLPEHFLAPRSSNGPGSRNARQGNPSPLGGAGPVL